MNCSFFWNAINNSFIVVIPWKRNYFLPRIPSMLWLDLPPSEPLRSVPAMEPPLKTLEMDETLGALVLSQTPSCSGCKIKVILNVNRVSIKSLLSVQSQYYKKTFGMTSVTRKKSPNVYKSCLKMISLEKWHLYKNCLRMQEIWTNLLLPKALKSCPKFNKSPNLVTLYVSSASSIAKTVNTLT